MAKEARLKPGILFLLAASLLFAAWLIKPFPLFVFFGLAPLLALLDHADDDRSWDLSELILASLVLSFFTAHGFTEIVGSLIQGIIMTLAFIGASFVRQRLGIGQAVVILFWLTLEYVLALSPTRNSMVFLGDALAAQPDWIRWTAITGYSGTTLWILVVNFLIYRGLLSGQKTNWFLIAFGILILVVPVAASYFENDTVISRADMVTTYDSISAHNFLTGGDVIHRIAAGISVVVILLALVKKKSE